MDQDRFGPVLAKPVPQLLQQTLSADDVRAVQAAIVRTKLLDQPIVVVNKAGGSGAEGYTYVKGMAGDPYHLIFGTSNAHPTSARELSGGLLRRLELALAGKQAGAHDSDA